MTLNPNNERYKSALEGIPFDARQTSGMAIEMRAGRGRKMEAHKFFLRPVVRDQPDLDRLGRAILELAMCQGTPCQAC